MINLEPLLICIVGGYVCTNQSKHRHRFIGVLQQAGPYVFLPFFTLTGASLDLKVMLLSFGFAAITASLRAACIFVGSSAGGWMAGVKPYTNPANMQVRPCPSSLSIRLLPSYLIHVWQVLYRCLRRSGHHGEHQVFNG